MSGPVQFTYPDTGRVAWFCICVENECQALAIGPYRTRESAIVEATPTEKWPCESAHFTTDRLGVDIQINWYAGNTIDPDSTGLIGQLGAHNRSRNARAADLKARATAVWAPALAELEAAW